MVNQFTGQIYEISTDLSEPLIIENFDITQDAVQLAGAFGDYTLETVNGNLNISTPEGALLATISGVTELSSYAGYNPPEASYLVSLENEFFDTYVESYFFEPIYPVQNPDVDELIAAGKYTSYYDHFLKAGQFEFREDTFLAGTESNDTMYSVGYETVLVGVPITQAQYRGGIDVVATDMGMGTVDTLYGGAGKEAIFVLGTSDIFNETPQSFYIGEGDEDYALIKGYEPGDRIFLGSDAAGFTQSAVNGSTQISKDGDLIAIVEGVTELVVRENDNKELVAPTTAFYTLATDGDDTIYPESRTSSTIGVPVTTTEDGTVVATSTGTGTVDTLYGSGVSAEIYLGLATVDSPDTPQPFYIGNGDEDYALIKDYGFEYDPETKEYPSYDTITLAGDGTLYTYEKVEDDVRISLNGDLIAIVENSPLLIPDAQSPGATLLYPVTDPYYTTNVTPNHFLESYYLENNPDASAAVEAAEYKSGLEHYLNVGVLAGRLSVYNGTNGSDGGEGIWGTGTSIIFGVPVTEIDTETMGFKTNSIGTGEADVLYGSPYANTFVLGSNAVSGDAPQSFYVGNGAEDFASVFNFDMAKDRILLAGAYEDYIFEIATNEGGTESLNISTQAGDLIAAINSLDETAPDLKLFTGSNPKGGFYLVGSELQLEPTEPSASIFGTTDDDTLNVADKNQLVFAGAGNDLLDATVSGGGNRIYGASGDDTFILGKGDSLIGDIGDDRFFVQTGGDNLLKGGTGADQFWIASAEIPTAANTVTDFTLGEDVIGIAGLGASFSSLTLTQQGENTLISFNEKDLAVLSQIQSNNLSAANFAFV
jgi:Ca2+-binding RTX toxin-like protein